MPPSVAQSSAHVTYLVRVAGVRFATSLLLLVALTAPAQAREPLDIRVFARIGVAGQPEPVAIGPDNRVYVGTNQLGHGDADAPSKVFAFSRRAQLVREYELEGQPLEEDHGIQGLAFDRDGLLYALDRSADPRVVVLDPATGASSGCTRASATCRPARPTPDGDCSATQLDRPGGARLRRLRAERRPLRHRHRPGADLEGAEGRRRAGDLADGPALESVYGPNGIQFMADGRTLLFVNTASNPQAGNSLTGRLYTVPVQPDGSPGELTQVWESLPLDAPDGLAIARSGNVYVALAGTSQLLLLSPEFEELARAPADPAANQARRRCRSTGPGASRSSASGCSSRITRRYAATRTSWAILDVFAGEEGLPLYYPRISKPGLLVEASFGAARRRLRVRVTRHLASATRAGQARAGARRRYPRADGAPRPRDDLAARAEGRRPADRRARSQARIPAGATGARVIREHAPHNVLADRGEIERFYDRASDLMRALLTQLAETPDRPRPFPDIEDALGWPRRRIASVLGGVAHMRHTEFGGRRPYHFHDERQGASGRWEMWMDADQAAAVRDASACVGGRVDRDMTEAPKGRSVR